MTEQTPVPVTACRSCGAAIYFAQTKNHRLGPFDMVGDTPTDVSHFKTCNDPKRFSRKPKGGGHRS